MNMVVAVLTTLALATVANAQCYETRSRTYYSYSSGAYIAPKAKVYTEYAPVYQKFLAVIPLVEYPTYSAVYAPPVPVTSAPVQGVNPMPNPAAQTLQSNELKIALEAIKKIGEDMRSVSTALTEFDKRLRRLEERQPVQPLPPAKQAEPGPKPKEEPSAALKALNARACAMCHERGKESNGGDFVLSEPNGSIVKLTGEQLTAMQRMLNPERPKMPKLTEAAKKAGITSHLNEEETKLWYREIDRQLYSSSL